jgi:aminomethyltransferase
MGKLEGEAKGMDAVVKPAGLGARDSLRLEAGMPLYGHEITEDLDPISAGLSFAVKLDKGVGNPEVGEFIGQAALQTIARDGPRRKLVGLRLEGRRSPRQGMKAFAGDREVGFITSGCLSPTLGYPIAMAYADAEFSQPGTAVHVDLGKASAAAEIVPMPFYKAS